MSLPYSLSGHTDCDAPLGVVVHQGNGGAVRLPIIDDGLQFHERKVGPTSITRRADVTIPIEGLGEDDWTQYINAFSPSSTERDRLVGPTSSTGIPTQNPVSSEQTIQQADVIGQPIDEDGSPVGDAEVLFRGYTSAIGSTEGTNRAQFRVYDPKDFLSVIEAGVSFKTATARDVLRYIAETFADNQNVFSSITVDADATSNRPLVNQLLDGFSLGDALSQAISDETIEDQFTFSTNRDTLVNVLELVTEIIGARVWFEPNGERGLSLRAVQDDSQKYDLTPSSDSPPKVIANNALYEMRPFNAVRLKGKVGTNVSIGPLSVNTPIGNSYPEATAVYPPLRDRFGGELPKTATSDITSDTVLATEAESRLKEMLDGVSGGQMTTTLAPMVRPYDRVEATPACSGVAADVPPLTYEVQAATHRLVPGNNNLPQTEIDVSMAVDPDLIETDSTEKDAQGGGEPSDSPAYEDYDWTTAA